MRMYYTDSVAETLGGSLYNNNLVIIDGEAFHYELYVNLTWNFDNSYNRFSVTSRCPILHSPTPIKGQYGYQFKRLIE